MFIFSQILPQVPLSEVVTRFETSPFTSHDSGLHHLLFFYIGVVSVYVRFEKCVAFREYVTLILSFSCKKRYCTLKSHSGPYHNNTKVYYLNKILLRVRHIKINA